MTPPIRSLLQRLGLALALGAARAERIATTFVVTSTADTERRELRGRCTLRQAINAANASATTPHTIAFNIPTQGVQVIEPRRPCRHHARQRHHRRLHPAGAAPNNLAEGSDARLLIQLDGGSGRHQCGWPSAPPTPPSAACPSYASYRIEPGGHACGAWRRPTGSP
jgi:CSLREA domain-containing protein